VRDWRIWAMGSAAAAIFVVNGGVTAFGSIIIKASTRFLVVVNSCGH
jgi:hypothetical protein